MTVQQWFIHLKSWARSFPIKNVDAHLWVTVLGENEHTCLICDAYGEEDEEENMIPLEKNDA